MCVKNISVNTCVLKNLVLKMCVKNISVKNIKKNRKKNVKNCEVILSNVT